MIFVADQNQRIAFFGELYGFYMNLFTETPDWAVTVPLLFVAGTFVEPVRIRSHRELAKVTPERGAPDFAAAGGDDDLERLILGHSPRFQAFLDNSWKKIEEGKGLSSKDFWRAVEKRSRKKSDEGGEPARPPSTDRAQGRDHPARAEKIFGPIAVLPIRHEDQRVEIRRRQPADIEHQAHPGATADPQEVAP